MPPPFHTFLGNCSKCTEAVCLSVRLNALTFSTVTFEPLERFKSTIAYNLQRDFSKLASSVGAFK